MAFVSINYFSRVLEMGMSANVVLPEPNQDDKKKSLLPKGFKYPVLWLLHGLSDDHTAWSRFTSIERYASSRGIAVVMPAGHKSFYNDTHHSRMPFQEYISQELPLLMRSFFPLSEKREDNFIAGLSMGGYGAFRTAMANPEKYGAAASLSGVADAFRWVDEARSHLYKDVLGDKITPRTRSKVGLFELASALSKGKWKKMPLFQCCGTEDFLYQDNVNLRDHMRKLGLNLTYEESPGTHEWSFWDRKIQDVLNWLPIRKNKIRWAEK